MGNVGVQKSRQSQVKGSLRHLQRTLTAQIMSRSAKHNAALEHIGVT